MTPNEEQLSKYFAVSVPSEIPQTLKSPGFNDVNDVAHYLMQHKKSKTIFVLGEHDTDEYFHEYFSSKSKALTYLQNKKPTSWYGKLTEYDIKEIKLDEDN